MSNVEIPCIDENIPHVCTPSTEVADFAYDLAHQAYSCLANTPNGLPGSFYTWMDVPPMVCCDELVVALVDSRRFHVEEFGEEILNVKDDDNRSPTEWQHEFWIILTRPCIGLLNKDGDMTNPLDRQKAAYNFMVDAQTLICCVQQAMYDSKSDLCAGSESYYFRPASYDHNATCARMVLPLVVGGDASFPCCACEREIDITP